MPAALFLFAGKRCCYAENVEKAQRGMVAVSERARSDLLQCALSEVQELLQTELSCAADRMFELLLKEGCKCCRK